MNNSTAKADRKKYNPGYDDQRATSGFSICKGLQIDLGGVAGFFYFGGGI